MEPKDSLPCSQHPATCRYPEPKNPVHNLSYFFQILFSHLLLDLSDLFSSGFQTKIQHAFLIAAMLTTLRAVFGSI